MRTFVRHHFLHLLPFHHMCVLWPITKAGSSAMDSTARSSTSGMYCDSFVNSFTANVTQGVSINESTNSSTLVSDVIRAYFDLSVMEFYFMHIIGGVTPLSLSLITVTFMLSLILCHGTRLYKCPIGDRLTVYLALCDLCYSRQDLCQHTYIVTMKEALPYWFCAFAGELNEFLFHPDWSLCYEQTSKKKFVMIFWVPFEANDEGVKCHII